MLLLKRWRRHLLGKGRRADEKRNRSEGEMSFQNRLSALSRASNGRVARNTRFYGCVSGITPAVPLARAAAERLG